jgi:hypothetical protein
LTTSCRWRTAPFAFDVGRTRLEPHDVRLLELKLGGVFNRHDPLAIGDERRQHVEQCGLAGAGSSADQDVELQVHAVPKELEHVGRDGPVSDEVLGLEAI